ncbi:hypothetical protein NEUTE1DRAFT_102293 [Neurospora tetrasperma FGSC 2508]|uniref:Heterokaryon incompatibility domain-containing protein n=1 Tax=Neurospora tetrasperma (strain FGSC 2508 / ATCC MYA-4615 / P0657) TaxID=510951 RepID=F8MNY8_NEUT8|nr:uncharacterized protein NEUTE1DRAFT_102293 [Neurospora tetrasperma FGSC 2508]EGO57053.1 hypothetical protein NEUTE1DRAFT_102293 [Neurospora tetrasperma FGSC 2508]EGZ70038.1 HET-domain-containing protein [Neurospora tetrasperma FGSC 2509]
MSTRPTPPEDESSRYSNTETIFISSNCPTATKLCGVCSKIPAWFWTWEFGKGAEISVELQPFKEMRAEAQNGCGLCKLLCSGSYRAGWNKVVISTLFGTGKLVKKRTIENVVYGISCQFEEAEASLGEVYPIPSSWRGRSLAAADKNSDLILIQDWITNCQLNHTSCNNVTKDFLPTRLLDVEAFNNGRSPKLEDNIKLVRSASDQIQKGRSAPRYITLSHCWGPPEKHLFTTTRASLSVRMERISFAELPRTFQDAVVLTRKLGQRYLWIDSLCIIQDEENEWAREASTMADVYTQSYCTLAALSSKDSTAGLRKKTQTDQSMLIDISANDGQNEPFNVRLVSSPDAWNSEYDGLFSLRRASESGSPLQYRAWALQEKELSTRVIHFGFRQQLWECCELKGTTQLPWYHAMDIIERVQSSQEKEWAKSHPQDPILFHRMTASWLRLCEDYSIRSLTKETDTLIALSGIAQSFQKYFPNAKYIAGIWTCHLPLALLWRSYHIPIGRDRTDYIAPSWSWVSPGYRICYEQFLFPVFPPFRRMTNNTPGLADRWLDELEVVGIKGQPKHGDDYGALKEGAALELKGALLFELDPDLDFSNFTKCDWIVYFRKDGVPAGGFSPNAIGPVEGKLLCLGIFCHTSEGVTGLILREDIHDGNSVYSRVGYVAKLDPSLWDGSKRRQITLI